MAAVIGKTWRESRQKGGGGVEVVEREDVASRGDRVEGRGGNGGRSGDDGAAAAICFDDCRGSGRSGGGYGRG